MEQSKIDFEKVCMLFGLKPEQVIEQFMADLVSGQGNSGSDERRMAKEYFLRGYATSEHSEQAIHMLEGLYKENYPSGNNTDYVRRRKEQMDEWFKYWKAEFARDRA